MASWRAGHRLHLDLALDLLVRHLGKTGGPGEVPRRWRGIDGPHHAASLLTSMRTQLDLDAI